MPCQSKQESGPVYCFVSSIHSAPTGTLKVRSADSGCCPRPLSLCSGCGCCWPGCWPLKCTLLLPLISGNELSHRNVARKELFSLSLLVPGSGEGKSEEGPREGTHSQRARELQPGLEGCLLATYSLVSPWLPLLLGSPGIGC